MAAMAKQVPLCISEEVVALAAASAAVSAAFTAATLGATPAASAEVVRDAVLNLKVLAVTPAPVCSSSQMETVSPAAKNRSCGVSIASVTCSLAEVFDMTADDDDSDLLPCEDIPILRPKAGHVSVTRPIAARASLDTASMVRMDPSAADAFVASSGNARSADMTHHERRAQSASPVLQSELARCAFRAVKQNQFVESLRDIDGQHRQGLEDADASPGWDPPPVAACGGAVQDMQVQLEYLQQLIAPYDVAGKFSREIEAGLQKSLSAMCG